MTVLHYPPCSTCKKALAWLKEQGAEPNLRNIKEQRPNAEELTQWLAESGQPIRRLFNTSGQIYRSLGLRDKLPAMSEGEMIDLLATDGMLVRRPILITEKGVCFGFDADRWSILL